jgi:RHS repeat-associated protein
VTSSYAWNAESEIKTANSVNYTYDGDGNRVQKSNGKIYWYGAGTEILDESDASGNITDEYVFFGGKRVAHRSVSSGNIFYYAEDLLGSSRAMVQAGQTIPCYDADFYPYGGEKVVTSTCPQNYKFEGKERDTETGNDDFGARYYSSVYGRWLSPDWSSVPAPVPYAHLNNPQTLNLYAMVEDNPETFADLDGHETTGTNCDANTSVDCSGHINTDQYIGNAAGYYNALVSGSAQSPSANKAQNEQTPQSLAAQVPRDAKAAIAAQINASNSPTADDKQGGYHEESLKWGKDASSNLIVALSVPGAYAPPGTNPNTVFKAADPQTDLRLVTIDGYAHIHPKGDGFVQPPSEQDKAFAGTGPPAIHIVVGARDNKVYFFNSSGAIGKPMKLKDFLKESQ